MPRCLHRERGLDFQHVVALGASPDYFQLGDMRVMNVSRVDNKTGRQPAVGDVFIDGQLITQEAFAERFEVIDPLSHIEGVEDLIENVEFAKAGSATICILNLKDGIHIVGHINPPVGDFLTSEEGEQLAYADSVKNLAGLESHRIARRFAAQEFDSDPEDLQPHR